MFFDITAAFTHKHIMYFSGFGDLGFGEKRFGELGFCKMGGHPGITAVHDTQCVITNRVILI